MLTFSEHKYMHNLLHTITMPTNECEPIKIPYSVQINIPYFWGGRRERIRREVGQAGEVFFSPIEKTLQVSSKSVISGKNKDESYKKGTESSFPVAISRKSRHGSFIALLFMDSLWASHLLAQFFLEPPNQYLLYFPGHLQTCTEQWKIGVTWGPCS